MLIFLARFLELFFKSFISYHGTITELYYYEGVCVDIDEKPLFCSGFFTFNDSSDNADFEF